MCKQIAIAKYRDIEISEYRYRNIEISKYRNIEISKCQEQDAKAVTVVQVVVVVAVVLNSRSVWSFIQIVEAKLVED